MEENGLYIACKRVHCTCKYPNIMQKIHLSWFEFLLSAKRIIKFKHVEQKSR